MKGYDAEQLARLEPPYVARYGMDTAPFSSVHEDRFVYLDADRLQRLNMLQHLARYSDLLLIITGEKGIGKTSLRKRFTAHAETNEEWVLCQVDANPMMDANTLLKTIATGFGLSTIPEEPSALQEALYHHLANLHHSEHVPFLIIDDAHALPQDALETLFNLADAEAGDGNLLRIILFCDPQIETMLENPAIQSLRERITHTMTIPPLDEEQTAQYIRHRLHVAGLQGPSPFNSKDLKKIYRNSGGVPARINECAHLLLAGGNLEQAVKDFHIPKLKRFSAPQISIAGAAAILIVIALINQDRINALFEDKHEAEPTDAFQPAPPDAADTVTKAVTPLMQETPPLIDRTLSEATDTSTQAAETQETIKSIEASDAQTTETISAAEKHTPLPTLPVEHAVAPALHITGIEPNPVPGSRKPQTLTLRGEGFTPKTRVKVSWSGRSKILSANQVEFTDATTLKLYLTVGVNADDWRVQVEEPRTAQKAESAFKVSAAPVAKPLIAESVHGNKWILQQNPQHFTLQLLGSYNKASIQRFIKQHQLKEDVAYFVSQRQGRTWYALIQGNHPDRPQAQRAATTLRQKIKDIKPWIRPYAHIQAELKKPKALKSATVIPATPPLAGSLTENAAWLWSQNPSHYTLQLLAGHDEGGIRRFVQQHALKGKALYYKTTHNNRPWYVLVYGSYPDRSQAKVAINKLPIPLNKTRPWPRSFGDIHGELQ